MKRTLLAATLFTTSSVVFAQAAAPSGEWKGSMSLGASFAQNAAAKNTNFSLAGETSRETKEDKISLYATTLYGKSEAGKVSSETANNFKLGGRYEFNFGPATYAFAGLDFERDSVANLDSRIAVGLGAGYYFVKSEPLTFTVFGGLSQRFDKYSPKGSADFTELMLGEESVHKLSSDMSFKQRLVLFPNLTESSEFRAALDATLSVKLAGAWNMNLSLINRYDTLSAGKKNDMLFLVGVGAKFGK